jgi:hypothetical protein
VLRVDQEAILFMDLDYGAIEHKKWLHNTYKFTDTVTD